VTNFQTKALIMGLAACAFWGISREVQADILFKGKQPLKIGLGQKVGDTIKWTDCSGKNPESFAAPPYALDSADNCSVGPATFGLECEHGSCKVVDEEKFGKYLSGTRNGDKIQLRIREHSVQIQSESTTLQLER
jgi:hypothetical protein